MKRRIRDKVRRWLGINETEKILALHIKATRDFMAASTQPDLPAPGTLVTPTAVSRGYDGHNQAGK